MSTNLPPQSPAGVFRRLRSWRRRTRSWRGLAGVSTIVYTALADLPREPGEAFGTYTSPACDTSRHSPSQLSLLYLMSPPGPPALQQLHHLSKASPTFHDQLRNVLYGEEYRQCVPNLEGDNLVWLVDYLDKVPGRIIFPRSPLKSD